MCVFVYTRMSPCWCRICLSICMCLLFWCLCLGIHANTCEYCGYCMRIVWQLHAWYLIFWCLCLHTKRSWDWAWPWFTLSVKVSWWTDIATRHSPTGCESIKSKLVMNYGKCLQLILILYTAGHLTPHRFVVGRLLTGARLLSCF